MGASVRPEPDNWLVDLTRNQLPAPSSDRSPVSPYAPTDALAVRRPARQPTMQDYIRTGRQVLGGAVEGAVRLPTDLMGMLGPSDTPGSLRTVGRGEVRWSPAPSFGSAVKPAFDRMAAGGEHVSRAAGDYVAGGAPANASEEDFRLLGDVSGNILAGEALFRAPGMFSRAMRGAPKPEPFALRPGESHRILREDLPERVLTRDHAGVETTTRGRTIRAPMMPEELVGHTNPRGPGDPSANGQQLFNQHLKRVGLLNDPMISHQGEEIVRRAQAGGFTINPRTGKFVESGGYMVGGVPGQLGAVVPKDGDVMQAIRNFERDNAELLQQPGMQAGGWMDDEGRFHIDVSQEVPTADEAHRLMTDRNEMSAWHLDSMSPLENPNYNAATRADHAPVAEPVAAGLLGNERGAAGVPERIVAAASKMDDGRVFSGSDHGFTYDDMREAGYHEDRLAETGFVTSTGRFVDREEAAQIAKSTRQLNHNPSVRSDDLTFLASEDINESPYYLDGRGASGAGILGGMTLGGATGAAAGSQIGDTPEERFQNGLLGLGGGMVLGGTVGHAGGRGVRRAGGLLDEAGAVGSWEPTPRGVLDRAAPPIQGTAEIDPRLPSVTPRAKPSTISRGIAESPVVRAGLLDDAEQGMPLGGESWYETGPLKQAVDEVGGPFNFNDVTLARGSGSIQNPTHNEVATVSGLLFGEQQGLGSAAEISARHKAMYPHEPSLWLSDGALTNFRRARSEGIQLPSTPGSAERKVPWYTHGNLGGSADALPALDTHERRRLIQLAAQDPKVMRQLRNAGILDVAGAQADVAPILNGADYDLLGSMYRDLGRESGARTTQQFQAGRWIGGGKHTGLKSQPVGDFTQTMEDALLHTARTRGLDESPAGLKALFERIVAGQDFATPVYGKDPFKALYSGQGLLFP